MAFGESGRRPPVRPSLAEPRLPVGARRVGDDDRGFVPHAVAGLVDAPDEIDVLADAHGLVEATDAAEHVRASDQAGGRYVRDAAPGTHARRLVAEVEGRMDGLVSGQGSRSRPADDAGRDEADALVGEVRQQRVEPPRSRLAVGVDERDESGGDRRQSRVAGGPRTAVLVAADDIGRGHGRT